jgi:hypothetical protein
MRRWSGFGGVAAGIMFRHAAAIRRDWLKFLHSPVHRGGCLDAYSGLDRFPLLRLS